MNYILPICILTYYILKYLFHLFDKKIPVTLYKQPIEKKFIPRRKPFNVAKNHLVENCADTKIVKSYFLVRQGDEGNFYSIREFKLSTIEESRIAADKYLTFLTTNNLILRAIDSYVTGGFKLNLVFVETLDGNNYSEKTVRVISENTMVI